MVKICPHCGKENLDFKIYCGHCGQSVSEPPKTAIREARTDEMVKESYSSSMSIFSFLGSSKIIGFLMFFLPIPLTLWTFDLIAYLSYEGIVSWQLIYGSAILIVLDFIVFLGNLVLSGGWGMEKVETPVRIVLSMLLFFSGASVVVLLTLVTFGEIDSVMAWMEVGGVFIFIVWLLFYGPMRQERIDCIKF